MSLTFPSWVKPVTSKSYGYSFDGGNMTYTETTGGISRASLKYVQNKVQFTTIFVLDNGLSMQAWQDWYFNRSEHGTSKFYMSLDSGNGLEDHVCIIVPGTYSVTGDFPWTISFTVEAEQVFAPLEGNLYDLYEAGVTNVSELLDRLAISANDDISVIGDE
jgi:hypothetical protein